MPFSKSAAFVLLTSALSSSAFAACPIPAASVQKIFDLIEAKRAQAALEAITYADVSVNAGTRNAKCETFYHAAFRTEQKDLLAALKKMGLGVSDPNAVDPQLGVSLAEYAFRFGSLARVRASLENGANLPSFPGSERNLLNALIGLSNATALNGMLKDGTVRIREMATALVAFRAKSMDDRARFSTLADAKMVAFIGGLRTELHSKDVAATDKPLAEVLAALEAGMAPTKLLAAYVRRAAQLSPSYASELSSELQSLLRTRGANFGRVKELIEVYGVNWTSNSAEAVIRSESDLGNVDIVRYLLARPEGAATLRSPSGSGGFARAISNGSVEIVKAFLAAGADPSKETGSGYPIAIAVQNRKLDVLKLLLSSGASANPPGSKYGALKSTPLCSAAYSGDVAIVNLLVAAKANLNSGDPAPLFCAAMNDQAQIIGILLAAGADPRVKAASGATLLTAAVRMHDSTLVKTLIAAKVDPSAAAEESGRGKVSPLYYAIAYPDAEMVKLLLSAGANPNVAVDDGQVTDLFNLAVSQGDIEIVKLLIRAHAKMDGSAGQTPLQVAILKKNHELFDLLMAMKVPVNQVSAGSEDRATSLNTALHTAVLLAEDEYGEDDDELREYAGFALALLKAGASTHVKDGDGHTVGHYATFKVWGPTLARLTF